MICLQHNIYPRLPAPGVKLYADISFTDDMGKNMTWKRLKIKKSFASRKKGCMPLLKGSDMVLLVSINVYDASVLHIQNPVTKSQAIVVAPNLARNFRGFYFHPASGEYRILCAYVEGVCFKFKILSLKTKSGRKISNSSHVPSSHKLPTAFNGALHWIINDEVCDKVLGKSRHCSNAIVIFHMEREELCTMPHPGDRCELRTSHHFRMDLMEYDGRLCLCNASSRKELDIWILEDYTRKFWVKKLVVIIEPFRNSCDVPVDCYCELCHFVKATHIYGDDLLIRMCHSDVFLCNLNSGYFRRVGNKCMNINSVVSPFVHINSLASLNVGDIVSLLP